MIQPTRLDIERAEAEKLQERTDYMLNSALKTAADFKERLAKCEALNRYARHRASCTYWNAENPGTGVCNCGYEAAHAAMEEK